MLAEIRASVLHHLGILYRITLETGRPLSAEDLEPSRELARRRAAQGVPLGEFLTFFLVGLTLAWEHLMESVGDDVVLRSRLLDRVTAVISNQTQLMTALTEAYVRERERLSRFREQDLDEFCQLLLAEDAMENVLEARARALGVPLDVRQTIAILGPPASTERPAGDVGPDELWRRLVPGHAEALVRVGRSREGLVALLPERPDADVLARAAADLLAADGRTGLGSPGLGVEGLRRSAREAQRALRVGMILRGSARVHRYADVAVLDLVGVGSADADAFVRIALGPLAEPRASRTTLDTLRQLARHGYRMKPAAAALSVHPHTLSYRVKQIRRRFGLDLDDPEVRLRVHLALLIRDAQSPPPGERRGGRRAPERRRS